MRSIFTLRLPLIDRVLQTMQYGLSIYIEHRRGRSATHHHLIQCQLSMVHEVLETCSSPSCYPYCLFAAHDNSRTSTQVPSPEPQ